MTATPSLDALRAATAELQAAGIENAATDARRLLAHAMQVDPGPADPCS